MSRKKILLAKAKIHNRDVQTFDASSFVLYRKVLTYLKQRSNGAKMQLWNKTTFSLYYFVLAFEKSWVGLLMLPHFKHVEMVLNPNFCLVSKFDFCLGFVFLFHYFFNLAGTPPTPTDLFVLTAYNLNPITFFFKCWPLPFSLSLSLKQMTPQSLLYLFCICEMFK